MEIERNRGDRAGELERDNEREREGGGTIGMKWREWL